MGNMIADADFEGLEFHVLSLRIRFRKCWSSRRAGRSDAPTQPKKLGFCFSCAFWAPMPQIISHSIGCSLAASVTLTLTVTSPLAWFRIDSICCGVSTSATARISPLEYVVDFHRLQQWQFVVWQVHAHHKAGGGFRQQGHGCRVNALDVILHLRLLATLTTTRCGVTCSNCMPAVPRNGTTLPSRKVCAHCCMPAGSGDPVCLPCGSFDWKP